MFSVSFAQSFLNNCNSEFPNFFLNGQMDLGFVFNSITLQAYNNVFSFQDVLITAACIQVGRPVAEQHENMSVLDSYFLIV